MTAFDQPRPDRIRKELLPQRGQSTVEFAVLMLVLAPLLVIVPLLGKYLDLAHTTEVAARYVAFEATVANTASIWKSQAELAPEVRRRFFSRSDTPIKTGDTAGNFAGHRNPLWSDHTGAPLLPNFETAVSVTTSIRSNSAPAGATLAGSGGFGLPRDNEVTGTVTVRPADIAGLPIFDSIDLQITRHQVILADSWAARSPSAVKSRIEGAGSAYPIAPLKLIGNTLGTALPPLVFDPAMDVGNVQPEIIPCDRLEGGC